MGTGRWRCRPTAGTTRRWPRPSRRWPCRVEPAHPDRDGRHPRRARRSAAAEAIYDELRTRAGTTYIGYAEQGAAAAAAGRLDEARALVAQAIAARDPYLVFWKLPAWAPFREDAEGMSALHRAGLTRLKER